MEQEKQIREMARDICENCRTLTKCDKDICTMAYKTAEYLTEKGWKKIVMCCECKYCTVGFKSVVDEADFLCIRTGIAKPVDPTDYCSRAKMKGVE